MFQQLNVPAATLLPLVPLLVKPIQLRLPITTTSSIHIQNTKSIQEQRECVCGFVQIKDGILVLLAGGDGDLFELHDRSDLRSGVLILRRHAVVVVFVAAVLRLGGRH